MKFNSGPPPSIGWWPTRIRWDTGGYGRVGWLRWWNGTVWSMAVRITADATNAGRLALITTAVVGMSRVEVQWADRPDNWPAHSYT